MIPTVYKIVFPDGQFYVGATVNLAERKRTHTRHLRSGRGVNSKLQNAFDTHRTFTFTPVASGLTRAELHFLERQVIEQDGPQLNVNKTPTPLPEAYSGSAKQWGPHRCLRDAAEALGVSYLAVKRASRRMSYEDYTNCIVAVRAKPIKHGPPDPRKNSNLVFLQGWVRRSEVRQVPPKTYRSRVERGWTESDALVTPLGLANPQRKQALVPSLCARYGVSKNTYYARRHIGWTALEALNIKPRNKQTKMTQPRRLTHAGSTMSIDEWAEKLGVRSNTIHKRLHDGWSVEKTLTTPVRSASAKKQKPEPKRPETHELRGVTGTIPELAKHLNIKYATLYGRIKSGWLKKYWLAEPGFPYHSQPDAPNKIG